MARAKRAAWAEPVGAFAHVDRKDRRISPNYIDTTAAFWRWGAYIPVVIVDARDPRAAVFKGKGRKSKARRTAK